MYADEGVIKLKHDVLYYVAKMAFEGTLEEKKDLLPMELIPGPLPKFRCCVYREREIVRERIRLAEGKHTGTEDDGNLIQVISSACEGCPISSYVVTDNCMNCVGKACVNACNFGACEPGRHRSHIDPTKCKECGKCADACPYHAIAALKRPCKFKCPVDAISYDENNISVIDEDKCIRCGLCIHACPFGAIGSKTMIVDVIEALKAGKTVYAMAAPATEGQYGENITMKSWKKAMKAAGFKDFVEVGLGGDLTAAAEAEEWAEAYKEGKKMTTSCCPAFVNMIRKHFPELADRISTSVSPMCAVSRLLKAKEPDCVTVFIGPCISKKSEAKEFGIEGNADYALIYSEFEALMKAKDVKLTPVENNYQESSVFGKRFANAGGVAKSCLAYLKEEGFEEELMVHSASGAEELKTALKALRKGDAEFQFVEGMFCEGGCFYGPSSFDTSAKAKRNRELLMESADKRSIHDNLKMI